VLLTRVANQVRPSPAAIAPQTLEFTTAKRHKPKSQVPLQVCRDSGAQSVLYIYVVPVQTAAELGMDPAEYDRRVAEVQARAAPREYSKGHNCTGSLRPSVTTPASLSVALHCHVPSPLSRVLGAPRTCTAGVMSVLCVCRARIVISLPPDSGHAPSFVHDSCLFKSPIPALDAGSSGSAMQSTRARPPPRGRGRAAWGCPWRPPPPALCGARPRAAKSAPTRGPGARAVRLFSSFSYDSATLTAHVHSAL